MEIVYLPVIDQQDFEAFIPLLRPDGPASYEEWLTVRAGQLETDRGLKNVREIKVYPNEFAMFLASGGEGYGIRALHRLAKVKGTEEA